MEISVWEQFLSYPDYDQGYPDVGTTIDFGPIPAGRLVVESCKHSFMLTIYQDQAQIQLPAAEPVEDQPADVEKLPLGPGV